MVMTLDNPNPNVLLLIDTARLYGRELINGISKYSRLHGPWAFHTNIPFMGVNKTCRFLFDNIDGAIIYTPDPGIITQAIKFKIPAIVRGFDGHVKNVPNLVSDNNAIGRMAGDHFLKHCLNHFAFYGYPETLWSQEREAAFTNKITDAGFISQSYCQPSESKKLSPQHSIILLSHWIKQLPKPIGIFAANDDRGVDLINACRLANIKVPDDVSILGVGNEKIICELANPPLSSVATDFETAGYQSAELLEQMMKGEGHNCEEIVAKPINIIQRQSTDILAVNDEVIVAAIRFIRQNRSNPISVDDVLNEVAISRRHLDHKFKTTLGHSIHEEITRARIDRISQMLLETDHTISQIAFTLGFTTPDHIGRFFRRHKGVTPSAFRRK